jgi:hypothetical protein
MIPGVRGQTSRQSAWPMFVTDKTRVISCPMLACEGMEFNPHIRLAGVWIVMQLLNDGEEVIVTLLYSAYPVTFPFTHRVPTACVS